MLAPSVLEGMGATPDQEGVSFRVWAPNARGVSVVGTFNDWDEAAAPMTRDQSGHWHAHVAGARAGEEYRFVIDTGEARLSRIDPRARAVTNSVGNGVIVAPGDGPRDDGFAMPPWNELVIYELHIGTFGRTGEDQPGTFADAADRLDHLARLGVNAVQVMPAMEFPGDVSWGYNPAHLFAVETSYGGPEGLRAFVDAAHARGIAVILDVVYNHFGPSDLDLWQFDGWSENAKGGIYFYNDDRSHTPWGDTRPDYGREEVRRFIVDNALYWLEEYRLDGLRLDMTLYMRSVGVGGGDDQIPDGWSLMQQINDQVATHFPGRITIAEDLQDDPRLTAPTGQDGAGFGAQWDAGFVHPVRQVLLEQDDAARSMGSVADALGHAYNGDPFERVIYTESHDEVANGKARVPHEIAPGDPGHWAAQKRSTLGAALVFTAPGIPMLFQGQEFLQGEWFQDTVPLDWDQSEEFHGIVRLYRDLVRLRLNRHGTSRGLAGRHVRVHRVDDEAKLVAFHRFDQGGPGDDVVVVANFGHQPHEGYPVGLPRGGLWRLRLNTDWSGYSDDFGNFAGHDVEAIAEGQDGMDFSAEVAIGAYSVLIYSQDG